MVQIHEDKFYGVGMTMWNIVHTIYEFNSQRGSKLNLSVYHIFNEKILLKNVKRRFILQKCVTLKTSKRLKNESTHGLVIQSAIAKNRPA